MHEPCIDDALKIKESSLSKSTTQSEAGGKVTQVVSYSSRFVDKISEVVRTFNISAAARIKAGTIDVAGHALSFDETKFIASDLNAIISVKVTTHTATSENAKFQVIQLDFNEKVNRVRMGKGPIQGTRLGRPLEGIVFIELHTTLGLRHEIGDDKFATSIQNYCPYDGCRGLKGWWGSSGGALNRLGPIWGR